MLVRRLFLFASGNIPSVSTLLLDILKLVLFAPGLGPDILELGWL